MDADTQKRGEAARASSRVLVVATDALTEPDLLAELRRNLPQEDGKVVVIAPAVEKTAFHHALGDVDTATREARQRLDSSLVELRRLGLSAMGEVGDSDPVTAAADALRQYPADEVLIVAHADDQARWFEDGLFERARETLYPPVRLIAVRYGDGGTVQLARVERSGPGRQPAEADHDLNLSANLPRFNRGDLAGIVLAVVGTIVAIVLAATGPGTESAAGAAQILIAMGISLVNMAHVVGLLLLESVHYRGGWQRFFRNLSLIGTPAAIVANLLITLLS